MEMMDWAAALMEAEWSMTLLRTPAFGLGTKGRGHRSPAPRCCVPECPSERFRKAGVGSFLMTETFRAVCVAKEQYRKFLIFQVRRQVPGEVPLGRPEPVGQQCSLPAEPGPALRPFSKLLSISRTRGGLRVHSWPGHYLGQALSQ